MKIIDLLNKIAKDEEVPKKIKIDEIEYKIVNPAYPHMYKDYRGYELEDNIHYITRFLDKEIEIIEEEKEIKKLDPLKKDWMILNDIKFTFSNSEMILVKKINELIDVVNEIRKEK